MTHPCVPMVRQLSETSSIPQESQWWSDAPGSIPRPVTAFETFSVPRSSPSSSMGGQDFHCDM